MEILLHLREFQWHLKIDSKETGEDTRSDTCFGVNILNIIGDNKLLITFEPIFCTPPVKNMFFFMSLQLNE